MLKIMIADDEYLVLESFKLIVERFLDHVEVVAVASNGREAVEKALQYSPDLIFMDIKMPGMSGLDAIEQIHKIKPEIEFIIITAYEHFDYAREALHLGVLNLLTKPLAKDVIIEAIQGAVGYIEETRSKFKRELELKENVSRMLPIIENQFVMTAVLSALSLSDVAFYKEIFDIEGDNGYILLMDVVEEEERSRDETEKAHYLFRKTMKEHLDAYVAFPLSNRLIAAIVADEIDQERVQSATRSFRERIFRNGLARDLFGVCGSVYPLQWLRSSYREAVLEQEKRIDEGIRETRNEEVLSAELMKTGAEVNIDQITRVFDKHVSDGERLERLKSRVLEFYLELERSSGESIYGDGTTRFLEQIVGADTIDTLRNSLLDLFRQYDQLGKSGMRQLDPSIQEAVEFIETSLDRNITLREVADHCGVSYYYFSRLFKDETGKTFKDYVYEKKIKRAIRMMKQGASVKEVSLNLGIADANYFSKIFKKYTGSSPTDYKAQYLG